MLLAIPPYWGSEKAEPVLDPTVMKKGGSRLIRLFLYPLFPSVEKEGPLWESSAGELLGVRQFVAWVGEV
jgi:hypothetical protein